jgi:peptidyl-tRNA hydrolase, PTH1 family
LTAGIRLIVGLGNPGPQYAKTRHNVGAWFIQQLADQHHVELKFDSKLHGSSVKLNDYTQPIHLFTPDTFMNESGQAILAIAHYYKIVPENILIAHDEIDFTVGQIKIKAAGGHGGHNGLRDTIQKLSSKDFYRLRIGVGHPGHKDKVTGHVLNKPSQPDEQLIYSAIDEACRIVPQLVSGQFEQAQLQLHSNE